MQSIEGQGFGDVFGRTIRRLRYRALVPAALVSAAALVSGALAASTNFTEVGSSPVGAGDGPLAITAADFDGDGDPDLAVANNASANVTILRNSGAGGFAELSSSPEAAGTSARSIAAADVDGDGDQDLAVTTVPASVTILLNVAELGPANFGEPSTSPEPVGGNQSSLTAADLDGDVDADLAVASGTADNVTILRNVGAGNFSPSAPVTVGDMPHAITAADLDGDGDRDLATANFDSNDVTILRNKGAGGFSAAPTSPETVGIDPAALAAADLDGDGDRDLVVANQTSDTLTVLRNGGTGDFKQPATSPEPAGEAPFAVAAADFDLDGDQDLAVANAFAAVLGTPNVTILRNNGVGNFGPAATSPEVAGGIPAALTATDFDADGDRDLAVANAGTDNVTILRNK